jgi:ech hydrogenase subunit A
MMLAGAVGTPVAVTVALMLITFHAVAKALLFLEAGVMEKLYKAKTIYDMRHIVNRAPVTVFFVMVGFLSMTMVPFAMFVAKWLLISEMANLLGRASYIVTIAILAAGGAFLTVLYLKILGVLISRDEEEFKVKLERQPFLYAFPNTVYVALILTATLLISPLLSQFFGSITGGILGIVPGFARETLGVAVDNLKLPFWQILIAFFFVVLFPIIAHFLHFKVDHTGEYSCGEPLKVKISTYNLECLSRAYSHFEMVALALFVLVLVVGGGML